MRFPETFFLPVESSFGDQKLSLADSLALRRQYFVSPSKEARQVPGFSDDPMGELPLGKNTRSFIHKYPEKILILTTNRCPVLCRFCTRKRITFEDDGLPAERFRDALDCIRMTPQINEVIFSGGDPFMLSTGELESILGMISPLNQVRTIRFHSRMPTLRPGRFDSDLANLLETIPASGRKLKIVLHINHPAEISEPAARAFDRLRSAGAELFCQSVLLRRVNDSEEILERLYRLLPLHGIRAYYLHQLDRVTGSAHFEVSTTRGLEIMRNLSAKLSAETLPRYVQDGPGGKNDVRDLFSFQNYS